MNTILITVIAAIASGVVGISVSQSCLRPIHSMSRLMKEMNVSDLSARLDTTRIHTELRDVATHYNQMMDRLEASYAAQNRFVSDASHELRTPLTTVKSYTETLLDGAMEEEELAKEFVDFEEKNIERLKNLFTTKNKNGALDRLKQYIRITGTKDYILKDLLN